MRLKNTETSHVWGEYSCGQIKSLSEVLPPRLKAGISQSHDTNPFSLFRSTYCEKTVMGKLKEHLLQGH